MSKVIVYEFSEGRGMYTKGTRDKDKAVKAMREYAFHEQALDPESWDENSNQGYDPNTVTDETVKSTWYYKCGDCNVDTIGDDNMCFECGESIGTGRGRHTFAFFASE